MHYQNPIFAQKVQNLRDLVLPQIGCGVCDYDINRLVNTQDAAHCSVRYFYDAFASKMAETGVLMGWSVECLN